MSSKKEYKTQKGFSLIELAVVLTMFGITMLSLGTFVSAYVQNAKREKTVENLDMVMDAVEEFAGLNGYYPCPADPTAAPGDANYGVSQCRAPGDDPDSCAVNVPAGLECTTTGSRDGDGNGFPDVVMIGAIPFRTLYEGAKVTEIREHHKKDGYGALLNYAVTEHLTEKNAANSLITPYNPLFGAITVVDENGNSLMDPAGEAQFIIYSSGEDNLGGRTDGGVSIEPCTINTGTGPAAPTQGSFFTTGGEIQRENCDNNDAIFASGLLTMANNSRYYDDFLYYKGRGVSMLWKRSMISPNGQSYLYNTNLGNVGVGISTPTSELHVAGDISTDLRLIADNGYCDPNGTSCLDPDFIAGAGDTCPSGTEVAYAIGSNQLICRDVEWTIPNKSCPIIGGQQSYLQGLSNLGNLYCCNSAGTCEKVCDTDPCPTTVVCSCAAGSCSCI